MLLLLKNILLSREPIYGIGEWAESYAPELLDLFEPVQRHELRTDGESDLFFTELTPLQKKIASLLGVNPRTYGR